MDNALDQHPGSIIVAGGDVNDDCLQMKTTVC